MCGIAGLLRRDGLHPDDTAAVVRMSSAQIHRGPDGDGVFADQRVVLGHRRLSIIDVSAAGGQPMANEDRTVWVTYNGEIYNHRELRTQLESAGHVFETRTDTEVLLHSYVEWGTACVDRLDGMFAFALWDRTRGELLLARDRIGIKPLYYAWSDDRLVFGSEIKAILEYPDVPRAMDVQSMYHYLGYEFVPGPASDT